ncbi:plant-specific transcription factor YABBY family protein isoform X2 [Wolffia australiana]
MSPNLLDVNTSSSSTVATSIPTEQLCYLPCSFCNIILAVSVPCSSLFDVVTVRCGHCTNMWSVDMAAALHSLCYPWPQQQQQLQLPSQLQYDHQSLRLQVPSSTTAANYILDFAAAKPTPLPTFCNKLNGGTARFPVAGQGNAEKLPLGRPPEKKQRVPSVYNQFIKEEIQRIKANNPEISHREAFSTAAKNWAHFPHIQFGLMLESNNQGRLREGPYNKPVPNAPIFNK